MGPTTHTFTHIDKIGNEVAIYTDYLAMAGIPRHLDAIATGALPRHRLESATAVHVSTKPNELHGRSVDQDHRRADAIGR